MNLSLLLAPSLIISNVTSSSSSLLPLLPTISSSISLTTPTSTLSSNSASNHISYTEYKRNEIIVSIPSNGVPLPECPFCDLRRCQPLPFCYTLKNGLRGNTIGEYCGTEWQLASLVRDQLANGITNDACQPSISHPELAYCWCQNVTVSETVEDDLRRVRIWRIMAATSSNLLYPFQSVLGHVDYFNKMLLDRLRTAATRLASGVQCRRWTWTILLTVLFFYVFIGSTCFWVFEHDPHDRHIRKWFMNLAVNRRHFARSISSRIFNDTRNLLIIIDRDQTERVQQILVESLKRYEDQLAIKTPDRSEWTFLSSFNFAYGLLLTLGHGAKTPSTIGGQIFALTYCLFGIPLFYGTLCYCVYAILSPFLESTVRTIKRRLFVLYMVILMYILWNLLLALFLYYQVFDSFWNAVFTSFLSGLTIQVPQYSQLTPCCLFVLLMACTVSAVLLVMAVILFMAIQFRGEASSPLKKAPLLGDAPIEQQQKFTVIVDEAGSSKLAEE